jgi:SnoaL-like domain
MGGSRQSCSAGSPAAEIYARASGEALTGGALLSPSPEIDVHLCGRVSASRLRGGKQTMTEDERVARACIAKTLGECTQAGDARKSERYAQCFTEDGVLELDERLEGREAIRAWMAAPSVIRQSARPAPGFVSHHLTTCRIDFTSATTATVRTYWLVTTAIGLDHNGYYDDQFRRCGEEWLIAHRKPRTLWSSPNSLVA